ncbi:hypothetical protein [Deinococcus sp. 6GRE01]|uniref:hypothetical protein n=1 Tax=Deinococcus sp. 6GRE01 TaxID=2745873 RepID=UPI001E510C59|nr:hypothetical protein [Deinococcus sp. 6GRE01]MCD0157401.1 hypothetical protein [Deinococcus sp. 6GRE01]
MNTKAALLSALMTLLSTAHAATGSVTPTTTSNSVPLQVTVVAGAGCTLSTTDISVTGTYLASDPNGLTQTATNAVSVLCTNGAQYQLSAPSSIPLFNTANTSSLSAQLTYTFTNSTVTSTGGTDYYNIDITVPTGQTNVLPETHTGNAYVSITLMN